MVKKMQKIISLYPKPKRHTLKKISSPTITILNVYHFASVWFCQRKSPIKIGIWSLILSEFNYLIGNLIENKIITNSLYFIKIFEHLNKASIAMYQLGVTKLKHETKSITP